MKELKTFLLKNNFQPSYAGSDRYNYSLFDRDREHITLRVTIDKTIIVELVTEYLYIEEENRLLLYESNNAEGIQEWLLHTVVFLKKGEHIESIREN